MNVHGVFTAVLWLKVQYCFESLGSKICFKEMNSYPARMVGDQFSQLFSALINV